MTKRVCDFCKKTIGQFDKYGLVATQGLDKSPTMAYCVPSDTCVRCLDKICQFLKSITVKESD